MEGRVIDLALQSQEVVTQAQNHHTKALTCDPLWSKHEADGRLPAGAAHRLQDFRKRDINEKSRMIETDPIICSLLFKCLELYGDDIPIEFVLAHLYSVLKGDSLKYDQLVRLLPNNDLFTPLYNLITRPNANEYIVDKSAYILTGFFCHTMPTPESQFSQERFQLLLRFLSGSNNLSETGKLEAFANLMKDPKNRANVFNSTGVFELIKRNLVNGSKSPSVLYSAIFCAWVASFDKKLAQDLIHKMDAIQNLRLVLSSTRVEKVIRVSVATLRQLMASSEHAIELAIEMNILQTLNLLSYEKWRDRELYQEVRDAADDLAHKQAEFTSFDRYLKELNSGALKWSFLHEDDFWKENVGKFDDNEFAAVKTLVSLISTPITTGGEQERLQTLAVALHDIGEFARYHPIGKKVLAKFNAKAKVLAHIGNADGSVAREALTCVQKIMLERWEDAAAQFSK